jgi:hypothetical protein
MGNLDIPALRPDKLATVVPTAVYTGTPVVDQGHALFLWRTYALSQARGMTAAFFVWDSKLEPLWRDAARQTARLLACGVRAAIGPDFSLWRDAQPGEQQWNTYRTRWLERYWQEHGIPVIPNVNWSGPQSYQFCFTGIPVGAPVVAVEARTAGQNDADRLAFLAGLRAAVRQTRPQCVLVYGGLEHEFWLRSQLPKGPEYRLIESWTSLRDRVRRAEERRLRHRHQLTFTFHPQKEAAWADEAVAAEPQG